MRKTQSEICKVVFGAGLVIILVVISANYEIAQSCIQAPSGLVSWWPGENNANDIIDGNTGMLLGGTSFTPAKVEEGFTFDSDDDRVTIAHNANLDVNSPGFTAEFWMQGIKNQPQSLYLVVDKSHGFVDNSGWAFQGISQTGELFLCLGDGGSFPCVGSVVDVLDGNFRHIAGTWDGSVIQLYVDGVLTGSVPLTTPANNTRAVNIGFAWGGGSPVRFFRGQVDELSIYNRALTVSEIQTLYNASSAGKCNSPMPGLTLLGPAKVWIGLINSDDQGTQFDLRTQLFINNNLVSEGETPCIMGATKNPNQAKEVSVAFGQLSSGNLASGDVLSLKVLTRIGTNPDNTKCAGPGGSHSNAVGLRLYYDATLRASRFGAEIVPDSLRDFFLHSNGATFFADATSPTASTAKFKDSPAVKFAGGNQWKEIGTWSRTQP